MNLQSLLSWKVTSYIQIHIHVYLLIVCPTNGIKYFILRPPNEDFILYSTNGISVLMVCLTKGVYRLFDGV